LLCAWRRSGGRWPPQHQNHRHSARLPRLHGFYRPPCCVCLGKPIVSVRLDQSSFRKLLRACLARVVHNSSTNSPHSARAVLHRLNNASRPDRPNTPSPHFFGLTRTHEHKCTAPRLGGNLRRRGGRGRGTVRRITHSRYDYWAVMTLSPGHHGKSPQPFVISDFRIHPSAIGNMCKVNGGVAKDLHIRSLFPFVWKRFK
jgi:hypothetical protein